MHLYFQVIRVSFFSVLLNDRMRPTDKETVGDGGRLEHRGEIFVTSVGV